MDKFQSRLVSVVKDAGQVSYLDNDERRKYFSIAEIIRCDAEEFVEETGTSADDQAWLTLNKDIDAFVRQIPLVQNQQTKQWWFNLDSCFRFSCLVAGFVFVGVFASVPVVLLKGVDSVLGNKPDRSLAESIRRQISVFFLNICGVEVSEVAAHHMVDSRIESSAILTFAHASNLDGFLVSKSCLIPHFALAKKELFVIPFFSWISLAIGGVPVDRNNRERAILALQRSTNAVKGGKMCIVVAPEGTRSTTGHLHAFKKGTFHIWEQLRVPIVPVVTYGAFELYPGKHWMNSTGTVTVRYLEPIFPHEASTRDQMMRLLRRRMLLALMEKPAVPVGRPLSWMQRIRTELSCVTALGLNIAAFVGFRNLIRYFDISALRASASLSCGVVAVTVSLYVYNVYLIDILVGKNPAKSK